MHQRRALTMILRICKTELPQCVVNCDCHFVKGLAFKFHIFQLGWELRAADDGVVSDNQMNGTVGIVIVNVRKT